MREPAEEQVVAGRIARQAIELGQELCRSAIDGPLLDRELESFICDNGGKPALKGYHPPFAQFPYDWTICLALDNDVVHGVPIKFVSADHIITIDLVVEYQGWYADTARTFTFSKDLSKKIFVDHSAQIFQSAIEMIMPGQSMNMFASIVSSGAEMCGYGVVKEYCGHGIGKTIHMSPQVINVPDPRNELFQTGQSYAVEPVLALDPKYRLEHDEYDGFSVRANCLASHNEDTIFIGPDRIINLTGNLT